MDVVDLISFIGVLKYTDETTTLCKGAVKSLNHVDVGAFVYRHESSINNIFV